MKKSARLVMGAVCAVYVAGAMTACSSLQESSGTASPDSTVQVTAPGSPTAAPTASPTDQAQASLTATPTEFPTTAPAVSPTTPPTASHVPEAQAVAAVYPSSNLEEVLGGENLALLKAAGVIAQDPEKVTVQPAASEEGVVLERVETFQDSYVLVTLNARLARIDTSDFVIKKYTDNWYQLEPATLGVELEATAYTLNEEGKTVLIYKIGETIDGTRIVPDDTSKKLTNLEAEIKKAENYMSWQMEHGGWDKGVEKQAETAWNGVESKNRFSGWTSKDGQMLGTIDNDSTYTQMRQIAAVYRETGEEKYKESVLKGLDFIFNLQYESGGFAQVYPRRGNYSDYVTFNDEAMINVLIMLEDMRDHAYPFDSDILSEEDQEKIEDAIERAVDYILKAQITSEGRLTAWCAQHDPETYEPKGGRAYELPSISGSESVAIVKFLIHQKDQTEEIQNAVNCALEWFRDSEVKGLRFDKNDPEKKYFIEDEKSSLWYRFYEIDTNRGMFCDRDGIVKYDITEIGEERRNGYSWSGSWPRKLLTVYEEYGFYENQIEAVVEKTNSETADGSKLQKGSTKVAEGEISSEN